MSDHDTRADALRLALRLLYIVGPPFVAAVARTVRGDSPELVPVLEGVQRALERDAPPIGATPPSADDARALLRSRREARRMARFGK